MFQHQAHQRRGARPSALEETRGACEMQRRGPGGGCTGVTGFGLEFGVWMYLPDFPTDPCRCRMRHAARGAVRRSAAARGRTRRWRTSAPQSGRAAVPAAPRTERWPGAARVCGLLPPRPPRPCNITVKFASDYIIVLYNSCAWTRRRRQQIIMLGRSRHVVKRARAMLGKDRKRAEWLHEARSSKYWGALGRIGRERGKGKA